MPAEADIPPAPQMPRIVITDATIEATTAILVGNPSGSCCGGTKLRHGSANACRGSATDCKHRNRSHPTYPHGNLSVLRVNR